MQLKESGVFLFGQAKPIKVKQKGISGRYLRGAAGLILKAGPVGKLGLGTGAASLRGVLVEVEVEAGLQIRVFLQDGFQILTLLS